MDFAICLISGRQYLVEPNKKFSVDYLGEIESLTCEQVMLCSSNGKVELGKPFLKSRLDFEVVGSDSKKIRVMKYHPKANYRKTRGSRIKKTTLLLKLGSNEPKITTKGGEKAKSKKDPVKKL